MAKSNLYYTFAFLKTAIVILNWNGQKLLEQFLPSVVNFSSDVADIYIADNASTDNSVAFVIKNYPSIKIIQNKENDGYAKGYNDVLKHIDADIYCLLNSDVEVTKNWLLPILHIFKTEKNTAVVQPKILDVKNKTTFEYAGAGGGFIDKYGYPYCRGRVFNTLENDNGQFDDTIDIFWSSGACLCIRSKVFHQLHGFDEDYFAHQEEIDLCWRVKNSNFTVKYTGVSTVYHVGGATLQETNPHKTFLNFRNSLFTILKNMPQNKLLSTIFIRLMLDGIAGIKFFIELKPIHTVAIIKAHYSFYKQLRTFLKKRKEVEKKEIYPNKKSIVWQYFFLGRKKYSDLQ